MRVLEIPYQVFMPGHILEEPAIATILQQSVARHGCFHIVVTSSAAQDPRLTLVLRRTISLTKHAKLEFMLPGEIARFERQRRRLHLRDWREGDQFGCMLASEEEMEGLTLMISGSQLDVMSNGKPVKTRRVERLGTSWTLVTLDLGVKAQVGLSFSERKAQAEAA